MGGTMVRPTRVALALGAGGARGYAHIGVIEVLEERGYEIVSIAGTSMGALVGGLQAAGRLEPYTEWVRGLTASQVVRLLDPSLRAPGVLRAEKILAKVSEILSDALIESLPVPFTAVATDLLAGKEVWLQEGPVDAAIRASIAIPSVITPVMINGRLLADGGLMNPIPTAATAAARADFTLAVSLSGSDESRGDETPAHETANPRPVEEWLERFRRSAAQVLDHELVRALIARVGVGGVNLLPSPDEPAEGLLGNTLDPSLDSVPSGLGLLNVMELSIDAMQSLLTRYRLAAYPPDILIAIPKTACRTLDFHKANEMIDLGRDLAIAAIERDESFPPAHHPHNAAAGKVSDAGR
jgi:NTE family protein